MNREPKPPTDDDEQFEAIVEYVRDHRGFDFSGYKRASLRRRVGKRMDDLGVRDYLAYIDQLEASPDEFKALFETILINVSSFFRDLPVWEYVASDLIPRLIASKAPDAPIRVWSAGCATGEEPYTIAMLLAEALGEQAYRDRVKIFATDVDVDAINQARQGVYTAKQIEGVPARFRERYFDPVNAHFTFTKDLRRSVIFGVNDLIGDAPISRLDLLTCRNTLIYFNADTQAAIMRRLHLALTEAGMLVLGKSELLLSFTEGFVAENLPMRVFRKIPAPTRTRDLLAIPPVNGGASGERREPVAAPVLDAFRASPIAQLVVDSDNVVVLGNESLRQLFGIAEREVGAELKDLEISYRPVELRSLIDRARDQSEPVKGDSVVWFSRDGAEHHLEVEVSALRSNGQLTGSLIAFRDLTRHMMMTAELEQSKHELENAYEELQSTVEELETTNEELQSTNEELETTNEELQSSNEELETMNEELQSSNEELETMNEELRLRTGELNRANLLVESMLTSLGVAVAVVDRELRVQMWNDRAKDVWGLGLEEVGGRHFLNLDIGLPVERISEALRLAVAGQTSPELRLKARDRRGHDLDCRVRTVPLSGANGEVEGAIIMMEAGAGAMGTE